MRMRRLKTGMQQPCRRMILQHSCCRPLQGAGLRWANWLSGHKSSHTAATAMYNVHSGCRHGFLEYSRVPVVDLSQGLAVLVLLGYEN